MSEFLDKIVQRHLVIREILLREWDPIGINDEPGAQREYDSYVAGVDAIIMRKGTQREIFEHLWELEHGHMGLSANADTNQKTKAIAKRLFELGRQIG